MTGVTVHSWATVPTMEVASTNSWTNTMEGEYWGEVLGTGRIWLRRFVLRIVSLEVLF